jgi:hypothetical protein
LLGSSYAPASARAITKTALFSTRKNDTTKNPPKVDAPEDAKRNSIFANTSGKSVHGITALRR